MPRALMVSSSFLPGRGGIESYLAALCEELSPHLAVFAPASRDGKVLPADLSYPTRGTRHSMVIPHPALTAAIEDYARRSGVDRVLFGTPWPSILLGPALSRRGLSYASIVHGAELLVPAAIPGVRQLLKRALAKADLLLTVSSFTAHKLEGLLGPTAPRIELLRARVDTDRFHPRRASEALPPPLGLRDERIVFCLGRLVRRKGVHRLIAACEEIASQVPDITVVVAGTGPQERRLRRLAARSRVRVVFAGRVSDDEAANLYAAAHVFALPVVDRWFGLDSEGFGVVLLEAQACETPCVVGRSGGTPEAVVDGSTGFVVDATDRRAVADKIYWLLEHPAEATAMGRSGRRFVVENFATRPIPTALLDWLGVQTG